jgi:hypothetical protein
MLGKSGLEYLANRLRYMCLKCHKVPPCIVPTHDTELTLNIIRKGILVLIYLI